MAELLTEDQIAEYRETFSLFDRDGDGSIEMDNLGMLMRALRQNPTEKELTEMKNLVDVESTNTIDFPEFLTLMAQRKGIVDTEEELKEAFQVFDKEGSGKLSAAELRHIMTTNGEKLNDEQADQLIRDADIDGTGQIDFNDFIKLIMADL